MPYEKQIEHPRDNIYDFHCCFENCPFFVRIRARKTTRRGDPLFWSVANWEIVRDEIYEVELHHCFNTEKDTVLNTPICNLIPNQGKVETKILPKQTRTSPEKTETPKNTKTSDSSLEYLISDQDLIGSGDESKSQP